MPCAHAVLDICNATFEPVTSPATEDDSMELWVTTASVMAADAAVRLGREATG
jgi:hypothetical protein